jgi:hypothetical protein
MERGEGTPTGSLPADARRRLNPAEGLAENRSRAAGSRDDVTNSRGTRPEEIHTADPPRVTHTRNASSLGDNPTGSDASTQRKRIFHRNYHKSFTTLCPYCSNNVQTETHRVLGYMPYLGVLSLTGIGLICGCCLAPLIAGSVYDIRHSCPLCRNEICRISLE